MVNFKNFRGTVSQINDFASGQNGEGCFKIMSVQDELGNIVNFIVSPTTYFSNYEIVNVGDVITGYYDGDAPAPLIFPPQYQALIIVKEHSYQNVKVDFFNGQLVSSDGQLKLNLTANTPIMLTNGQTFSSFPGNRNLIVTYGPTTRSIPAQTTPYKIIVWC
ncbi:MULTISPECIES: hypothetical protein [unclassified Rummeliibacillus]|uniref:hypothetical protein n=1 Tax=unclassified Rummeliibacillus TaxID=2622809 RepID=UPI000E66FBC0|nr:MULTISPECIES: hypothetical protein [unclassified Rummeliibacillus]RIJ67138.1 hypothetical protein D1606_05145 [Rummeliibacillus sp. POC4]RPJ93963.1 hypothetical protein CW357_17905 [Rummeliibacillus sp. TYF005]